MANKLSQSKAEQLLADRFSECMARATPDFLCKGHEWQKKVLASKSQNLLCMCSRRAGKSEVACALVLLTAAKTPDVSCLFLGLTKESAGTIWRKFRRLLRRLKLDSLCLQLSDTEQLCVLPNKSRILFSGTDDVRRVTHLLGDSLAGGIAVLDECQDDPGLLEKTVTEIIAPMADEQTDAAPEPGRIVMLGTVPDVGAGFFWSTFARESGTDLPDCPYQHETEHWGVFCWSRFDNPFQVDNEKRIKAYCAKYKYEPTDAEVLRRWYGLRVFSKDSNAYRYVSQKHTYQPGNGLETAEIGPFHCRFSRPMPGLSHYIVGIDQAQRRDRFAVVAWGWNPDVKDKLYHVAEAFTDPGADPQESEWLEVCKELKRRYGGSMEFIRDAGGSSAPVNDLLQLSHGITIVSAVKGPGSVKARVQRLADLLHLGVAKVMEGSELSGDLLTAKWSMAAREKGKWEIDKVSKSPDLADAATYALDLPSFTQIGAPKPKPRPLTWQEQLQREQEKTLRDLLNGKAPKQPKNRNSQALMWQPPPSGR